MALGESILEELFQDCFAELEKRQNTTRKTYEFKVENACCVTFISNDGWLSLKELLIHDDPLHSISAIKCKSPSQR